MKEFFTPEQNALNEKRRISGDQLVVEGAKRHRKGDLKFEATSKQIDDAKREMSDAIDNAGREKRAEERKNKQERANDLFKKLNMRGQFVMHAMINVVAIEDMFKDDSLNKIKIGRELDQFHQEIREIFDAYLKSGSDSDYRLALTKIEGLKDVLSHVKINESRKEKLDRRLNNLKNLKDSYEGMDLDSEEELSIGEIEDISVEKYLDSETLLTKTRGHGLSIHSQDTAKEIVDRLGFNPYSKD